MVTRDNEAAVVSLEISDDLIVASLPASVRTITIHTDQDTLGSWSVEVLAADLLVLVAVLCSGIGKSAETARLVRLFGSAASVCAVLEVALMLMPPLMHANDAETCIQICQMLSASQSSDDRSIAQLWGAAAAARPGLSTAQVSALLEATMSRVQLAHDAGDDHDEGVAYYNASTLAHSLRDYDRARHLQRRAIECVPAYNDRAYFHREVGGNLMCLNEPAEALAAYERAIALDDDDHLVALAADASMVAGRYAHAEELLTRLGDRVTHDPAAALVHEILALVREVLDLDEQDRTPPADADPGELDAERALAQLTEHDALHPGPWIQLVEQTQTTYGAPWSVPILFARAAQVPAAWIGALAMAIGADAPNELVGHIAGRVLDGASLSEAEGICDSLRSIDADLAAATRAVLADVDEQRYHANSHLHGGMLIRLFPEIGDESKVTAE